MEDKDKADASNMISREERDKILVLQQKSLPNGLNPSLIPLDQPFFPSMHADKTSSSNPSGNTRAAKYFETEPLVEVTRLANGLQCITQESKNQPFATSIGLFNSMGSRYETKDQSGLNHIMELSSFSSTKNVTSVSEEIQKLGGVCYSNSTRDQTMYCLDIVRNELTTGMELFQDGILNGNYSKEEIDYAKMIIGYQWEDSLPEMKLGECLMLAAYSGSSLGKWHFCPPEEIGASISSESIHQFRKQHFVPNRMVLSATGLSHPDLVGIATQYFGHLEPSKVLHDNDSLKSQYVGGEYRLTIPPRKQHQENVLSHEDKDNLTRIALAFEIPGGWHSEALVPICVLQMLLGGGSSFSAGGPGKGMYSRLYREILNRYYWVESSEAFTIFHGDSGLFGIQGSTSQPASKSKELVQVFMEHFYKCANQLPTHIEVTRAKNMLKCNVLSQLESRLVIMEDLGRQILTFGRRESMKEMCDKIDAVTPEDIQRVSQELMKHNKNKNGVSLAVVGENVDYVPSLEEIRKWL